MDRSNPLVALWANEIYGASKMALRSAAIVCVTNAEFAAVVEEYLRGGADPQACREAIEEWKRREVRHGK